MNRDPERTSRRSDVGAWLARWQLLLRARATDVTGAGQPDQARPNALGHLLDGVVRHPVTVD